MQRNFSGAYIFLNFNVKAEYAYKSLIKDICYIPFGHVSLDIFRDSSQKLLFDQR